MTRPELDELAEAIFATLAGASPSSIRTLAAGLELAEEPAEWFARPVLSFARNVEDGIPPDPFAMILMRLAVRQAAAEGSLLVRLARATEPFWLAVSAAVLAVAEDQLPAGGDE